MRKVIKLVACIALTNIVIACSAAPTPRGDDKAVLRLATANWVETYNRNDWGALAN